MDEAKENQGAEQPVALAGVNGVTHAPEAAAIKAVAEGTTTEDQASAEGPGLQTRQLLDLVGSRILGFSSTHMAELNPKSGALFFPRSQKKP